MSAATKSTSGKGKGTSGKGKGTSSKPAPATPIKNKGKIVTHANGAEFTEERPGVVAFIVQMLLAGWASKSEILAKAKKQFPDRDEAKMRSTISMQVPSGLYIEKGYVVDAQDDDDTRRYHLTLQARVAGDAWRKGKRDDSKLARPAK